MRCQLGSALPKNVNLTAKPYLGDGVTLVREHAATVVQLPLYLTHYGGRFVPDTSGCEDIERRVIHHLPITIAQLHQQCRRTDREVAAFRRESVDHTRLTLEMISMMTVVRDQGRLTVDEEVLHMVKLEGATFVVSLARH
jgi:hypothetical protein